MAKILDIIINDVANNARKKQKWIKLDPIDEIEEENYPMLLQTLYQSGYFTEISVKTF